MYASGATPARQALLPMAFFRNRCLTGQAGYDARQEKNYSGHKCFHTSAATIGYGVGSIVSSSIFCYVMSKHPS
ncbi:uncharacterized protein BP01DRAFT_357992 [Aspergillus saccharolyticus JOP 1030-1]|uniref:Uncharacterized protein n=1 Tax=Aspergillus saccharolyticus JOP 1030-1 TaxID=1450539 RepID=A0A318Z9J2_9EURO|nr:hypothetical protein BP01DRAFT_357992 [Aspergillus saccharolyticus JOP 1030-1]PYH44071.1 hypothetical protein BP01DRAFT_357992 [Aspergillus saccharolyticus JOP 1030-1]